MIYIQNLYHYTDRRCTDGEVRGAGRCLRGIIDRQVRLISKTLKQAVKSLTAMSSPAMMHLENVFLDVILRQLVEFENNTFVK